MTNTEQPTERDIEFRCYAETPEQAAMAVNGSQPPTAIRMARERMAVILKADGYRLLGPTVVETSREAVVVDETGEDFRPVEDGETPTGYVHSFTATGTREPTAEEQVIVLTDAVPDGDTMIFEVPASLRDAGGEVRVAHNRNAEVTIFARDSDGEPATYLLASPVDSNVEHVELNPGVAYLRVIRDQDVP